jgi:SAM-dependent methyltransferase
VPTEVFRGVAPGPYMASSVPQLSDFLHPEFETFLAEIGHRFQIHRKLWEFAYVAHQLTGAGALVPGRRGLCFGAGEEPLPALLARRGCHIVATDAPVEIVAGGWVETSQHAASIDRLVKPAILDETTFRERVSFEPCDMNHIPDHLTGFDFCWSACCLEHLGSLQHGMDFVVESVEKTLKPGGVAVHTTELNLTSDSETVGLSLYRRRDILALIGELERRGHQVTPLALDPGATAIDYYVDLPPYSHDPHIKIQLDRFVTTSVGIMARKRSSA